MKINSSKTLLIDKYITTYIQALGELITHMSPDQINIQIQK